MVFVLREEVPEVMTRIRAYEQVTVHVDIARRSITSHRQRPTEVADLVVEPTADARRNLEDLSEPLNRVRSSRRTGV